MYRVNSVVNSKYVTLQAMKDKRLMADEASIVTSMTARGRPPAKVNIEELKSMFHLPQPDAAKSLGISLTTLKQVCRRHGMVRWPYRRPCKRTSSRVRALADSISAPASLGVGMPLQGDVPANLSGVHGVQGAASNWNRDRITRKTGHFQQSGLAGADFASGAELPGLEEAPQQRAHPGFLPTFMPGFSSAGNAGMQHGYEAPGGPRTQQFTFQGDFGWLDVGGRAALPSASTQRLGMDGPDQVFNGNRNSVHSPVQMPAGQMRADMAMNNMQGSHAKSEALQQHDGMTMSQRNYSFDSQLSQQQQAQIWHNHRMNTGLRGGGMGQTMGSAFRGGWESYEGPCHGGHNPERERVLMQNSRWGGGARVVERYQDQPSVFYTEYSNGNRVGPDYESDFPNGNLHGVQAGYVGDGIV